MNGSTGNERIEVYQPSITVAFLSRYRIVNCADLTCTIRSSAYGPDRRPL
jgi:hypothetical protein